MNEFSLVVVDQLGKQKLSIPKFAQKIGFSATYTYNLLNGKKRWNTDSVSKACEVLGLKVEFKEIDTCSLNV